MVDFFGMQVTESDLKKVSPMVFFSIGVPTLLWLIINERAKNAVTTKSVLRFVAAIFGALLVNVALIPLIDKNSHYLCSNSGSDGLSCFFPLLLFGFGIFFASLIFTMKFFLRITFKLSLVLAIVTGLSLVFSLFVF